MPQLGSACHQQVDDFFGGLASTVLVDRSSQVRRFCRRQRRGSKISDQRITQGRLTLIAAEELYAFRVTRRLNPLCRSDTCTGGERDRGQAGVH